MLKFIRNVFKKKELVVLHCPLCWEEIKVDKDKVKEKAVSNCENEYGKSYMILKTAKMTCPWCGRYLEFNNRPW